jgi:predicted site-specific integrase-resolvase
MKKTLELHGLNYDRADIIKERYGISEMTLYRWTRKGLLPMPIRLGRNRYFRRDEVEDKLSRGQ